jgi:hypothetical protein
MRDAFLMLVYFSLAFAAVVLACVIAAVAFKWWQARYRPNANRSGLYSFHDGKRYRYMDPITIIRKIETDPNFRLDIDTRLAIKGHREAMSKLADMVVNSFEVPRFTDPKQPGLTEGEMLSLFRHFMAYVDEQKKNSQRSATHADFLAAMSENSSDETIPATSAST